VETQTDSVTIHRSRQGSMSMKMMLIICSGPHSICSVCVCVCERERERERERVRLNTAKLLSTEVEINADMRARGGGTLHWQYNTAVATQQTDDSRKE